MRPRLEYENTFYGIRTHSVDAEESTRGQSERFERRWRGFHVVLGDDGVRGRRGREWSV